MSILARRLQSAAGVLIKLYISPAKGSFSTSNTFTCEIREDSLGTAVNTVQANVDYPTGLLQLNSVDTTGSPFTTTLQNTNSGGQIQLVVTLLSGSVLGDQLVGSISFTTLATGNANVTFATSSGIADANTASNVCQLMSGAKYAIS